MCRIKFALILMQVELVGELNTIKSCGINAQGGVL